jgi:hypothetical protein
MGNRMARSTRGVLKDKLSPLLEDGEPETVDALLVVASGPNFCPKAQRDEVLRLQSEFEPLVQMAIDAPEQLYKQEFSPRLRELAQGGLTVRLGAAWLPNGKQRLVYYREPRDIHAVLSQGLLLVMDEHKPYGAALCRCRLPSCQRFYLARRNPKGGPANRTYCSPEHRKEHHDSADRKAAHAKAKRARKGK